MFSALSTAIPERVAGFLLFATLGVLAVSQPLVACGLLVAFVALSGLAYFLLSRSSLRLWQVLVLVALSGYIVLNYGFANVAFHIGGLPIILGHALMFAALAIVVLSGRVSIMRELREPAVLTSFALILFSFIHLVADVPRFGFMAVRDGSLFIEGVFLLLGLAWAKNASSSLPLMKWLFWVFFANLLYCLSLPWGESIRSWSPNSGIFLVVPVFGCYGDGCLYLMTGALFCLWCARYAVRLPRWVLYLLAVVQLFALAIHQARSMYLAIPLVFMILILVGEVRKAAKIGLAVGAAFLVVTSLAFLPSLHLEGRLGPVTPQFLEEHLSSLALVRGTPGEGSIEDREKWTSDVWRRATSSTTNLLIGEGFGKPLIDFETPGRVAVRQPHNTHLTVLARLGLVGMLLWTLFHLSIVGRFLRTLRTRGSLDKQSSSLVLWLFLFYVSFMLVTSVQPLLEFSYGAIPFYLLMGFALGLMRKLSEGRVHGGHQRGAPAHT
jgi:hypothetical protein